MFKFRKGDRVVVDGTAGDGTDYTGMTGTVHENDSSPWVWMDEKCNKRSGVLGIPDGHAACFGQDRLIAEEARADDYSPTWQQAVRDFALQFISEYEPSNAADIAAAAITFTVGDDV